MERSIQASDRTTHAVRAFVRFLFLQLSATTLAFIVWNLSQSGIDPYECARYGEKCSGNSFFEFVAFGIFVVGVIYSSREGWRELDASEIR